MCGASRDLAKSAPLASQSANVTVAPSAAALGVAPMSGQGLSALKTIAGSSRRGGAASILAKASRSSTASDVSGADILLLASHAATAFGLATAVISSVTTSTITRPATSAG